jgi:hypothetical protein
MGLLALLAGNQPPPRGMRPMAADATRVAPRRGEVQQMHTISAYAPNDRGGLVERVRGLLGMSNLPQEPGLLGKIAEVVGLNDPASMVDGPVRAAAVVGKVGRTRNVLKGTKVVDELGQPKRVYHGTSGAFEKFDPQKLDKDALYGPGYYWTEDAATAGGDGGKLKGYSQKGENIEELQEELERLRHYRVKAETRPAVHNAEKIDREIAEMETRIAAFRPNVRPARMAMKNPFDINKTYSVDEAADIVRAVGADNSAHVVDWIRKYFPDGMSGDDLYQKALEAWTFVGDRAATNRALRTAGFDGITHIGGGNTGNKPHRVWIAFDRKQIRSPWGDPATAAQFGAMAGLLGLPALMSQGREQ